MRLRSVTGFISAIFFLLLLGFLGVIFLYQQVVNEGSVLADEHCLVVNPIIIERKKKHNESLEIVKNIDTRNDYPKVLDEYFQLSNKYAEAELNWLNKQYAYMNSWGFKTLSSEETKQAAILQFRIREKEYDIAVALNELHDESDREKQAEISKRVMDLNQKKAEYEYYEDELWNTKPSFYLLSALTRVPESKCPDENFDFPDMYDVFPSEPPVEVPENQLIEGAGIS